MRWAGVVVATVTLVLTVVLGPIASAANDWRAEVSIARSEAGTFRTDASYRDRLAVIAWQIDGDETGALHVAISHDAGRGTFATRQVANDVVGMAVAACGADAFIAYRVRRSDDTLCLRLARVPGDGGSIQRVTVRRSVPARGTLDLACGSALATIVWTQRVGSPWHALVRHVRLADLGRSPVGDLGVARRFRVAAAASGDRAYVAWSDTTGLRLRRFVAADGRPPRTQRLETDGRAPMVAADGIEVAVGYSSGADAHVVSSRDGGRTFPDGAGYGVTPGDASLTSLALEGKRGVATVKLSYRDNAPLFHRLSRPTRGSTWTGRGLGPDVVRPLDGFLVAGTGTKLAETFSRRDGDTGGWELLFRRER